jgi:hypothetical protein
MRNHAYIARLDVVGSEIDVSANLCEAVRAGVDLGAGAAD